MIGLTISWNQSVDPGVVRIVARNGQTRHYHELDFGCQMPPDVFAWILRLAHKHQWVERAGARACINVRRPRNKLQGGNTFK